MSAARREMNSKKAIIAKEVAKQQQAMEKERARLQGEINTLETGAALAQDAKQDIEFIMAPVPVAEWTCGYEKPLKEAEECKRTYFKGAQGWWEYMNGNKERGIETLKEVYDVNMLGDRLKNPYPEHNYAEYKWKGCAKKVE